MSKSYKLCGFILIFDLSFLKTEYHSPKIVSEDEVLEKIVYDD